jgi:hypothetical protein
MNKLGTKDRNEREDEEAERLIHHLPKLKPPRHDRRREEMQVDRDLDVEGDPDLKSDPDLSMNRREIGGSCSSKHYSSYSYQQIGTDMSSRKVQMTRTSIYQGVQPDPVKPYPGWGQAHIRDLGPQDFSIILDRAKDWLKSPVLAKSIEGMLPDSRLRAALDLAIRDVEGGAYSSAINSNTYNMLLAKLAGKSQTETLLTIRESLTQKEGIEMTIKFAKEEANRVLSRIDRIAGVIQANAGNWGIPFDEAKAIVNALDKTADEIEKSAYGDESLAKRQVEVLKKAKVIEQDLDEGYMSTFNSPSDPKQTDSDEAYMSLFEDDQTSALEDGQSSTGRPLVSY